MAEIPAAAGRWLKFETRRTAGKGDMGKEIRSCLKAPRRQFVAQEATPLEDIPHLFQRRWQLEHGQWIEIEAGIHELP